MLADGVHDRGVQVEVADHEAVLVDHPDVQVSHQDRHAYAAMLSSHSDVVKLGSIAQGETAGLVAAVSADLGVGQQRLSTSSETP